MRFLGLKVTFEPDSRTTRVTKYPLQPKTCRAGLELGTIVMPLTDPSTLFAGFAEGSKHVKTMRETWQVCKKTCLYVERVVLVCVCVRIPKATLFVPSVSNTF